MAKGYGFLPFDLERLRSLLDGSLKEIRRRYLHIDDEIAARLRSEVRKLLRFPDAVKNDFNPPTMVECLADKTIHCRLFDLLMRYEEEDVSEVPGIGPILRDHMNVYYRFRQKAMQFEADLMSRISTTIGDSFASAAKWKMFHRYSVFRLFGVAKDEVIAGGNFLNYGITWDETERAFTKLSDDTQLNSQVGDLRRLEEELTRCLEGVTAADGKDPIP